MRLLHETSPLGRGNTTADIYLQSSCIGGGGLLDMGSGIRGSKNLGSGMGQKSCGIWDLGVDKMWDLGYRG